MTLYLDTSSLVKLYVEEPGSDVVADLVARSSIVTTSVVAYAEARAVFARLRRERLTSSAALAALIRQFDADWPSFLAIGLSDRLARDAGALADRLGLRGFDAVHLASFQTLVAEVEDELEFSSADARLTAAAKRLG